MDTLALPVYNREVLDNSILSTHGRCPRLALYEYRLNRAGTEKSYPILFGVAYHTFREYLEIGYKALADRGRELDEDSQGKLFTLAFAKATENWEDPPPEHSKSYLDYTRLAQTCEGAFSRWLNEKQHGKFKVLQHEAAFDLALPSGKRFGGRLDQILEWNGRLWIRDFKTTSRMGKTYSDQFDPNHQFTGYVWAAQILSGRMVDGVMVEAVYNTKNTGPEFHPFLSTRTQGHIDAWLEWVESEYAAWERHVEDNTWPMRTTACNDYAGCFFRRACQKDSWAEIEAYLEENTVESHWDFMNPGEEVGTPD